MISAIGSWLRGKVKYKKLPTTFPFACGSHTESSTPLNGNRYFTMSRAVGKISSIYVIAAVSVVGGALFGFDISESCCLHH